MLDTLDERISPIRPLLYPEKITVIVAGFEAIADAPPRGWGRYLLIYQQFEGCSQ